MILKNRLTTELMWRGILSLCLVLSASAYTACGSDDPPARPAVAVRVGDVTVLQAAVVHTLTTVSPMSPQDGGTKVKPPRFTACVEAKRQRGDNQSLDSVRHHCARIYGAHERSALSELIQLTWTKLAAEARGLEPSAATVRRLYDERSRSLIPAVADEIRSSSRLRRTVIDIVRREERNTRLIKAFDTTPENLTQTLARRYEDQTTCVGRYRVVELPECTGALALD